MIKYWNENRALPIIQQVDVFAVRIFSLFKTYGIKTEFVQFWVQENDGCCTALISALDGAFTLSFTPDSDIEELKLFFQTIGFQSLQCDQSFRFGKPAETGIIFKKGLKTHIDTEPKNFNIISPCSLKSIYELNKLNEQNYQYEEWYADFSYRIRCGAAKPFGVTEDGQAIASTASYTAIWENNILIGYIATAPAARGRSYASKLLQHITAETDYNYFILCREALKPFYEELGFHETGKWSLY